jgi:hypothetical protein
MHAALQRVSVDYQTGTTSEFFHTDITVKNTRCRGMLDQLSACHTLTGCRFGDGRLRFGAYAALPSGSATRPDGKGTPFSAKTVPRGARETAPIRIERTKKATRTPRLASASMAVGFSWRAAPMRAAGDNFRSGSVREVR